jgi:hypothetical protein
MRHGHSRFGDAVAAAQAGHGVAADNLHISDVSSVRLRSGTVADAAKAPVVDRLGL